MKGKKKKQINIDRANDGKAKSLNQKGSRGVHSQPD